MAAPDDGPTIIRPIPRRPFDHDSKPQRPPSPLLTSRSIPESREFTPPVSRTHSVLNLTSSTLLGIYSPTSYGEDRDEPLTPWGTGAETPAANETYRPRLIPPPTPPSTRSIVRSLVFRSTLLFFMGTVYGLLVRHLHDDRQLAPVRVGGIIKPSRDWRYLTFWGVAGVALGTLLPWVDTMWEEQQDVGRKADANPRLTLERIPSADGQEKVDGSGAFGTEWAPMVRSIGAFVGIAFAIRKLPWTSTMQASLTLGLVNPVLWYLIDRSKPGLILSTAVGMTGTAILLGLNADVMPNPAPSLRNATSTHHGNAKFVTALIDYVGVERVEVTIWMISVLFCSCVCFGNVGRMLALNLNRRRDRGSLEKAWGKKKALADDMDQDD
ncbi:insulin-induced protein-domain-containing protein [Xylogone sp. PMI_703]|nr:insulin-induced protein-domain-containing protein [Xylogone sp. PMI_703]